MRSLVPVLYIIGSLFFLAGSLVTFFTPRENAPTIEITPDEGTPQPPPERLDKAEFHVSDPYERWAVSYKEHCGQAVVVSLTQRTEGA